MFKTTRTFASATCGLCLAYACIHVKQSWDNPFNGVEATPIPVTQASSDTGVTDYDVTYAYVPNLEVEYRTDMPWEKGFMITRRST